MTFYLPSIAPGALSAAILLALPLLLPGCGGSAVSAGGLSGTVALDGSSTVFPISEAVAEEFQQRHPGVRVAVGISGTGGGFKKFLLSETDINDASRPIKKVEQERATGANLSYIELPIAFDGISVVVNPKNHWVDHLSVEELAAIWKPGSTVKTWKDVRSDWPDKEIRLYGPGTDSGTFDYFTEAIIGKSGASRSDFTASEDDNALVMGIEGEEYALGYFGFSYYVANRERLKIVPVDAGAGPVTPSMETIEKGTYAPLARPLFLYVNAGAAARPAVKAFVEFYIENAGDLAKEVGYVALSSDLYDKARERFREGRTGCWASVSR